LLFCSRFSILLKSFGSIFIFDNDSADSFTMLVSRATFDLLGLFCLMVIIQNSSIGLGEQPEKFSYFCA